ncbi:f-box-like domain-containing protein [Ditylenchus destructor]|uniref:F-box-like domain-containing protein n=1 Tax=Ditylenchus destructor TaxID=166010 RepID=A0AAD4MFH2_9BILA|nr:f-box-like domain-containing protein [Ditylenchus destructor]
MQKLKRYPKNILSCFGDPSVLLAIRPLGGRAKNAWLGWLLMSPLVLESRTCSNINELPDWCLAQIFEKFPLKERLKAEQVCKKWQKVAKKLSWTNFRIFNNRNYDYSRMTAFFDLCGRYLHHLQLTCSEGTAINLLKMALNVQHLCLDHIKMNGEHLKELSQILPNLKSLHIEWPYIRRSNYVVLDRDGCDLGLVECFKTMTCLEYLRISGVDILFEEYSFVQFPHSLKYLDFELIKNADRILSWVAKGCKDLKGLRLTGCVVGSKHLNSNMLQTISQMKSLTYLALIMGSIANGIGYVFEALTELQAFEIRTSPSESSATPLNETHINIYTDCEPAGPEILFEMLRRYKKIRTIALDFGPINSEFFSRICQMVDEIDGKVRRQREFPEETHPMVELKYNSRKYGRLSDNVRRPYKWFRLTDCISSQAAFEKWEYGFLSAGKP